MNRVRVALPFWGTVLLALAHAPAATAGVPDAYGLGSRSTSMAAAIGADGHDFSALAYNPSGIVEASGVTLAAGYTFNRHRLGTNGLPNDVGDVRGVVAGLVAPGRVFGIPAAFGLALHLPDDGLSYLRARRQEAPRWELYDTRQQLLFLAAALAVRPVPWLELGGGIGFLAATRGRFGIRGTAELAAPFNSQLEHEVDADLTAVRYPILGARIRCGEWGTVGLAYRGASHLDLSLAARLDGDVRLGALAVPLRYDLDARTASSYTPSTVTASFSFQRVRGVHLNVDLSWVRWSAYESPAAAIDASLDIDPPAGVPIALPGAPRPTVPVAPGFQDRIVPRVGVEWTVPVGDGRVNVHGASLARFEVPLRAGYAYERSPVPEQRGATNFIDADRHTLAVGAGVAWNRPSPELTGTLRLDLHASVGLLPERTTRKDNPADFVGDFVAGGSIVGAGATVEVGF